MYEYSIFWIKEEIANHYFHRSDILYRFINEYQKNQERNDLILQFIYITNKFPLIKLVNHLKRTVSEELTLHINRSNVEIYNNDRFIALQIAENHLKFRCNTLQDAELLLFPGLRQFQFFLFVVGENIDNYGWISPVINKTNSEIRQVLYSHH